MAKSAGGFCLRACVAVLLLMPGLEVSAEPPSRAARLAYAYGTVSFSPAGQPDWVQAAVNRPLTTGDRLWTEPDSRAELQVGGAALRMGALTSVTLLNLDDRIVQVELARGTLKIRVRRLGPGQVFEVDTPNLAFTLRRAGEYRIDVDAGMDATTVTVQSGEGEVYGEGASYTVRRQQGYRFYGTGLSDYDRVASQRDDAFDRWARARDRGADNSPSARYVSPDVVGYQDLDANGAWRVEPEYGNVWTPTRVATGWTPYRDGHWAWIDPWGWTWVDDAPWGYAVSHYGRWANIRGRWSWVPGPPRERAVYAPALVAFVGGSDLRIAASVGGAIAAAVGWFPLAPREVYQPAYPVSRSYFNNINRSNTVIAPAAITNVYNQTTINNTTIINKTTNVTRVVYVNQQVAGAVVAVPKQTFAQSRPVAGAAVRLPREAVVSAPVVNLAAVAPVQESLHGGARDAASRPPGRERRIVARTAPPPAPAAFAAQQQQLASRPGRPIEESERKQMKPVVAATPAPAVNVVTTVQAPVPNAPPPVTAPAGRSPEARKAGASRRDPERPDATRPGASDAARPEAAKVEAGKAEAARIEAVKADAAKAEAAKAAMAKMEAGKADAARIDAAKAEAAKADAAKAATAKAEAGKVEAARIDAVKAEAAKEDAAKAAMAKAEAGKAEAARIEAAKADAAKAATAEAVKADAARREAARAENAKAEASRAAASKAELAKAESLRADAAKAEAEKAGAARSEAAKADAATAARTANSRAEAAKAEAAKAEAARAESANAARAADSRADSAKAEAAKAEAAKRAAARADVLKADGRRAEAAQAAPARDDASKGEEPKGDRSRGTVPRNEPRRVDRPGADAKMPADERRNSDEDSRRR